ncbi:MAG: CAP domain-containing protein [Gemmatimonadetes bacterium]|nr:CAP domain-containing protein [Gemmatimonadota bacterium]
MRSWLAVALAACAASGSAGGTPGQQECAATPGQRTLELVNEERLRHALPPLTADTLLTRAARMHAEDMAAHGLVGHTGSDGSDPSQRLDRVGYLWIWVGENVAGGQGTPEEVVPGWIRSEAHRANMLSPDAVSAGVAMARSAVGEYGTYWVMVYAAADPPSAAVVMCHP